MFRSVLPPLALACLASSCLVAIACSDPADERTVGDGVGTGGAGVNGSGGGGGLNFGANGGGGGITFSANSAAFQQDPYLEQGVDASAITAFEANPDDFGGGVCVFEPHLSDERGVGALYPMNWLRPRFRWTGAGTETLWEIRLSAASQTNDLRVYTTDTEWLMPGEMWEKISSGVSDEITVTIRGANGGTFTGMRGTFRVIPVLAGGSMVFWGTTSSVVEAGSSRLYGFTMGDEAVVDTMRAEQVTGIANVVQANGRDLRGENVGSYVAGFDPGVPRCIGCHSATPDGTAMAFTDDYPWNMGLGSVEEGLTGTPPDYLSAGARELMKIPFLGMSTMMPAPWAEGDRTMITTMGRRASHIYIDYSPTKPVPTVHDLIWIDLSTTATIPSNVPATTQTIPFADDYYDDARQQAAVAREEAILAAKGTAWGVLTTETSGSISTPASSKTGLRLAYTVSESSKDGHPDWHNNTADIKVLELTSPRASAAGSTPLQGASDPGMLEYYPAFSPDDAFIAFNQAPAPSSTARCLPDPNADPPCVNPAPGAAPDGPYYNRMGEVAVVPSGGGTPHRLRGNDPVACSGEVSPGVLNSWPKWSSAVREYEGKNYYFIIFSSARGYPGQFNLTATPYTPPIDAKSSQLYMSVVEHDPATGAIVSYAPIYLWNQRYLATGPDSYEELNTANLTPAWEDFSIPSVPPVVVVR